jgi:DNA-binding transcriptional LysR family regulator
MHWTDRAGGRIKLRDLHILLAVVERGSMSRAAEQLAVSVPVVSKTIADMERVLGVPLLDRSPQGIKPTSYGHALLDCSVTVFDELRRGLKQIEFLADPAAGELAIGGNEPLMAGLVPAVIDRLSTRHPRMVFHIMQGDIASLHRQLRERTVDLIVARALRSVEDEDLASEVLFDEQLFVVAGAQSAWARKRKVALADLLDAPWILPPADTVIGALVQDAFRAAGLTAPKPRVVSLSLPLRNSLIATGRYLAVVAGSMLDLTAQQLPVKVLPVKLEAPSRPVEIIRLKSRSLSPIAQTFIAEAQAVAKGVHKS